MLKKAINWAWISSLTLVGFLYVSAKPALAIPPQYFQSTPIITSGLAGPSSFEFSPDGRIFILQRTGEVKIFKNGSLLPQNFVTLPSANTGDRGLIGIAFDPDFDTNHYVYFYYTSASDLRNYLVRFSAEGDVATNGPVEIYKTPDQSFELHVGGGITFGVDGKLYLGIGDNGYGPNGQDLSSSHGKILRLNKDGSAPSDNPFFNTPGALPEIYTLGHRNPWRLTIDKVTNRMYVADVGANDWEEINQVVKGKNYGWSICEGYCNTPPYVDPIYSYSHNGQSSAVALGLVYRGNMFPSTYYGQLFFGDYAKYFLKSLTLDSLGKVVSVNDFDSSIGTVVDIKEHPIDGSLYYITYYPGRLYRLSYSTSNQIPTASAGASVTKGIPPLTVQFTSSGSTDPDNQPLSYMWDFGDGNTSTLPNPVHTYSYNGAFTVELTVSDGTNTARAVPVVIQVGLAPIVNIGTPLDGNQYKAGDMINYSAHAVDGTGNDINDTSISTEILFHHHTHIHPFYGPVVGRAGSVKIPDINAESDTDQWFEIRVTATDYNGLSTTKSVNIYPQTSSTLIQSNPPGLSLSLDGQPIASPKTVNRLVGYQSEVSAPETQILNNKIYHFYGWSDGGQRTHYFTQTTEPKSITALYFSPSDSAPFSAQYFPNKTLSGNPSLVRTDSQINFDWGLSSPDASLSADSFSVRWTSAQNFPPGLFRFTATGDDGIRLYVDGNLVIDQWRDQGPTPHSADVLITEGEHTVVYEYYESGGSAIAKLKWEPSPVQPTPTSTPTPTPPISTPTISPTPTPTPGSQSGFMASYYPNKLLSGTPVFTSVDPIINFDWGDNAPNVFTPKDDFSVRWIKNQTFDTDGTYRFTSASDDGIRLFVDGILVLNKWVEQSVTSYYVDIQLTKGDHQIVYEYFDACCSAVAKLSWSNISPQPSVSPTPTLTPTPTPTVVNTPTPTVTPTTTPSSNFTAMYYSNKQLTGSPVYTTSDPIINFDWGDNAPNVFTPKDDFSVKWTKSQMFDVSGIYRFTSASDDGVRLIIDNKLVIDKWVEQSSTTYSADIELHSGVHQIVYEYFDACCSAVAKLSWSLVAPVTPTPTPTVVNTPTPTLTPTPTMSPSTPTPTPVTVQETEFSGEYYANKILSGAPVHTSTDPIINFDWGDNAPNVFTPKDNFSVRWTANKNFPTSGVYKFTSSSDDGVRLYIDGNLIIDKWIEQSQTTYVAYVNISAGLHVIKYEYFDACCSAVAKLSWSLDSSIAPTPASTPTPTQGPTPTIQPTPTPTSTPSTINQFQAEFFNGKGFDSQPMETLTVPLINYYWGPSESPKNITSPDNFSSRFTGTLAISPGTYRFTVTGDDGVRLYINNAVVLDHWIDQSPTTYTADVNLSTDTINIKLEHYESGGEAVAKLVWTKL